MAIRYYDEALTKKIQSWIKDPKIRVLKPDESSRLFQMRNDQDNDKPLALPLISISRDPNVTMDVSTKRNLTCDGVTLQGTKLTTIKLEAIPININYQIDIYTKRYEEGDEYLRNFIFNFVNYPKLTIMLPYNDANIEHICYTRLDGSVNDTSNISEKLFPDAFTRWTIQLSIHDAFLFSIPVKENGRIIGADIDLYDPAYKEDHIEVAVTEDDLKNNN